MHAYVYVLVRRDLSPAQQIVQVGHSLLEAARRGLIPAAEPHPHLVVCGVADHDALAREAARLQHFAVPHAVFVEPDIPDASRRETALATAPISGAGRRLFRRYRLLGGAP